MKVLDKKVASNSNQRQQILGSFVEEYECFRYCKSNPDCKGYVFDRINVKCVAEFGVWTGLADSTGSETVPIPHRFPETLKGLDKVCFFLPLMFLLLLFGRRSPSPGVQEMAI